jgi:hypothetical protein
LLIFLLKYSDEANMVKDPPEVYENFYYLIENHPPNHFLVSALSQANFRGCVLSPEQPIPQNYAREV